MPHETLFNTIEIKEFILRAIQEDVGSGDHSSLAAIPAETVGLARMIVKEEGVIAGVELSLKVLEIVDPSLKTEVFVKDGDSVKPGDIALIVNGSAHSILKAERLLLNLTQRLSGIATKTAQLTKLLEGTKCQLLDTRKTTPGMRLLEKWAVRTGGGINHRIGLFDMVMLKDNHNDCAGGIKAAIINTRRYLKENLLDLKIEVETRNIKEVQEALETGGIDRIMLDNFSVSAMKEAVDLINGRVETEASGGITEATIRAYAETGVDYISVGALTHSVKALDISLKVICH